MQEENTTSSCKGRVFYHEECTSQTASLEKSSFDLIQGFKTLVLDLDETLVHSSTQPMTKFDMQLKVYSGGKGEFINVYVRIRPYAKEFLRFASKYFEVVIFTASTRDVRFELIKYAEKILDELDTNKFIDGRLFRDHCSYHMGMYTKDLGTIGRDLKDVILIDVRVYRSHE